MTTKTVFTAEEDYPNDIPKEKRKLETASYDYSVDFLNNYIKNGKIILAVPFQRQFIWKEDKCSRLIESIIMNVPIPPVYFAEESHNKWLVIDGLQRLSAIKTFFENDYALNGLEILKELSGLKYRDLPPKPKGFLNDGMLRIIVIKQESHPDIKFDIFMRLNNGSVSLNDQELRNCLYRGKLVDLAKQLTGDGGFLSILGQKKPDQRYLDVEFILRYLAFSDNVIEVAGKGDYKVNNYNTSIKSYINNYMEANKSITDDKINELKNKFIDTIAKVLVLYKPEKAFRDPDGKSNRVNKAIADCIMIGLERVSLEKIKTSKDHYVEIIQNKLRNELQDSIRGKTSNTSIVNNRINTIIKALSDESTV